MATVTWRQPYGTRPAGYTSQTYYQKRDAARRLRYQRGWRFINGKWVKVGQPSYSTSAVLSKKELKGVDTVLSGSINVSDMSNNNAIVVLNLIQQGTGSWNRIGRQANLKSLRISGELAGTWNDNYAILYSLWCRLIVVWDSQPSGIIPNKNDIFGNTSQAGVESSNIYDHIRYDNMSRFSILHDEKHIIELDSMVAQADINIEKSCKFDFFVNLKDRKTIFSGQSSPLQISDISTGALYFIVLSDRMTSAGSAQALAINGTARLRYTD
ncbi:capsid [uncultured virus]|uniref:Capsid n=1 Tax=uncultured virus TaxID=340016 RepID=A0A2K9LSJ2_9VIRU|nr:capsid [uncultured virus]